MNHRRAFLRTVAGAGAAAAAGQAGPQSTESDRQYWVRTMGRLAEPVLTNLAAGTLKRNMPVECVTGNVAGRRKVTHLEAIGRLLAGIAPWREAPLDPGPERDLQQRYADLAREAIRRGTDAQSADFLNFQEGSQPLVDCGFLAQALLRAPNELWKKLDPATRQNLSAGLVSVRAITPGAPRRAPVSVEHGAGAGQRLGADALPQAPGIASRRAAPGQRRYRQFPDRDAARREAGGHVQRAGA